MSLKKVFIEQYAKLPVLVDSSTCHDKVYIVTGSNNGLGLETARHLVRSSASRIILAVRNVTAGEKAKADIERTTGKKGVQLDRLDGLVENAGIMLDTWTTAEGGMETTMVVNVISTLFLGVLLMPKLADSAKKYNITPRIVFLVSALGFTAEAQKEFAKGGKSNIFEGLNNPKEQNMDQRYSLTKLVEMYAVRAVAEQFPFKKTRVIINMNAPGICSTGLARETRTLVRAAQGVIRIVFARSAEEGSRTTIHALVEQEPTHGKHLSGCKIKE
ncbi:short chain dehydrogenase [Massarina eburnea CBS 473.64]|uniref:Short chain dehydrogenase n=1 Tax=Massarina eburnea CBS 473.64 TaxID=1395130 RepID=A0A6A6RQX9_9PLEO|nr:short chain dehydrogenase [Massarina eburnea CBS 473.64]